MSVAFSAAEQFALLLHLLTGSKVGKGNVELGIFHIHIYTDYPLTRRELHARFDGIVKEIANDAAQINL